MAITSIGYNASFTGKTYNPQTSEKAETAAKVMAGASAGAAVTAIGITKGKNIGAFFKKIKMPAKLQEFASKVGNKVKKGFNKTGEYAKKAWTAVKTFFKKLFKLDKAKDTKVEAPKINDTQVEIPFTEA